MAVCYSTVITDNPANMTMHRCNTSTPSCSAVSSQLTQVLLVAAGWWKQCVYTRSASWGSSLRTLEAEKISRVYWALERHRCRIVRFFPPGLRGTDASLSRRSILCRAVSDHSSHRERRCTGVVSVRWMSQHYTKIIELMYCEKKNNNCSLFQSSKLRKKIYFTVV